VGFRKHPRPQNSTFSGRISGPRCGKTIIYQYILGLSCHAVDHWHVRATTAPLGDMGRATGEADREKGGRCNEANRQALVNNARLEWVRSAKIRIPLWRGGDPAQTVSFI
jgi:hypothetical protein